MLAANENINEKVCFRNMASFIINGHWYEERLADKDVECERIMTTAAKLARDEIRAREYSKNIYPNQDDLSDVKKARSFLTPLLTSFIGALISNEWKRMGIAHAIRQAVRPKSVIPPILCGLGIEMDHIFEFEWLVTQLHSFGFSISSHPILAVHHAG